MQTATIVYKTEPNEFGISSGAIVSSTSSPPGVGNMRPPPPPPPPKMKMVDIKLEEPSSSIPDLVAEEVKELRNDTRKEIQLLKNKNLELQQEVENLENTLQSIERKSKKYNLVIYGVTETQQPLYEAVLNIINGIVGIKCEGRDFRDIYRIGKNRTEKTRPIVIETVTYKLKEEILTKAGAHSKTLKREKIYFTPDYIPEDYEKQKFLREQLKQARSQNYKAYIKANILYVNGEAYSYEQLQRSENIFDALETTDTLKNHQTNSNSAPPTPSKKLHQEEASSAPTKSSSKITTRNTTRRNPNTSEKK